MVSRIQAVVLAAGRSSRFKTKKSKLLHTICGLPMIAYPLKALVQCGLPTTVVLGSHSDNIRTTINNLGIGNETFAIQHEQNGTAHAVACSKEFWDAQHILIINGDMPLVRADLIKRLIDEHQKQNAAMSFVTTTVADSAGYGRVVCDEPTIRIVEEKDCTDEQRLIQKINAGIYLVKKDFLEQALSRLEKSSVTGEFYLTSLVQIASEQGLGIVTVESAYDTVRGVNTLQELWEVEQIKRCELIRHWMSQGVRFNLPQSVHIDHDVTIGAGTTINTGAYLINGTSIGENCTIGPFVVLSNAQLDDEVVVHSHSAIYDSCIKTEAEVGPFARLRDHVTLEEQVVVGNFVELKKSTLGRGTKAKHLSYLGDAILGEKVNIGAGTITCNHDGAQKHATTIHDDAYVGSNTTLIAPVVVGTQAFTAAGSVINQNVPADDLAIARSKQTNKKGYAKIVRKRNAGKKLQALERVSNKGKEKLGENRG